MRDEFGIDAHKLIYHPRRIGDWLEGKNVYPVYMEVCPVGRCNHRCVFCAFDYLEYKGPSIETAVLQRLLLDAASHGVKSVMFAGEGEPLLHQDIASFVATGRGAGLDVAITTNGVAFNSHLASECLPLLNWIRFSLDAATKHTYDRVHRGGDTDFARVTFNIQMASTLKRKFHFDCAIGVQAVLIPENIGEMVELANLARGLGADYLVIKPFSKHPSSRCDFDIDYGVSKQLERQLQEWSSDSFKVIFRRRTIEKLSQEKPYKQCLGLPFITVIDSNGDIYPCNTFIGQKEFVFGNIYEKTFSQIWEGEQRQRVIDIINKMGTQNCRELCRLDEINRYLWQLTRDPPLHVNFI